MLNPFQLSERIQIANMLWTDCNYVCEESLSGFRCLLSTGQIENVLSIFYWRMYGDKLKDISNYFPDIKKAKFDLLADIDTVIVAPTKESKSFLKALFNQGPLGAEKLQFVHGKVNLVFTDLLTYKTVDLSQKTWEARRGYLEAVFNDLKPVFDTIGVHVSMSKVVHGDKRGFFDWICERGGKGVILKNKNAVYTSGPSRDCLEVANFKAINENISLKQVWAEEEKPNNAFDWDEMIAIRALEKLEL